MCFLHAIHPSQKLKLYALYKQATEGPCTRKAPMLVEFTERAKYDAWKFLGAMPRVQAQREYVRLVRQLAAGNSEWSTASASWGGRVWGFRCMMRDSRVGVFTHVVYYIFRRDSAFIDWPCCCNRHDCRLRPACLSIALAAAAVMIAV
jgi:acyl-CoA-binding protein